MQPPNTIAFAALIGSIPDARIEKRLAMQPGVRLGAGGESSLQDENPGKNSEPNLYQP
jgi:hypothetical protein